VGLSKNASTHVLREIIAHGELATNNAVGLSISAPLEIPRLPEAAHLITHVSNNAVEVRFFVWLLSFFRELHPIVLALKIDQRIRHIR